MSMIFVAVSRATIQTSNPHELIGKAKKKYFLKIPFATDWFNSKIKRAYLGTENKHIEEGITTKKRETPR